MTQIIVGLDESEGAAAALRWAVREANIRDGSVTAILAWNMLDHEQLHETTRFDTDENEALAHRRIAGAASAAIGDEAAATIEQRVVNDLAERALVEESAKADLLVVGARGLGGFKSLLLGSVSNVCIHRATCPVVVVHGDRDVHAPERIVVGVDGSAAAQDAVDWALGTARVHGAALDVIHAYQPPIIGGPFALAAYDWTALHDAASRLLDEVVDAADTSGVTVERRLACETAGAALVAASHDADLVVVGSRGRGGVKSLLLGSVSHQVAQHATCPVAVMPAADRAD